MIAPIPSSLWDADPSRFAERLGTSLTETGFAVVEGHAVPEALIARVRAAAKRFFALPETVKAAYADAEGGFQRGYTPFGQENAKGRRAADLKEFWHTGRGDTRDAADATPDVAEVEDFDAATRALFTALDAFGRELLRAVAVFLGLPRTHFDPLVDGGNSILRLLHYPAQDTGPAPDDAVRAAAHEDINVITLLLGAEEAGLQALTRAGDWVDIQPPDGALVVNVGDMLQRYTGGLLPSTTHRVVNPAAERAGRARYSMPFFLHFREEVDIRMPASLSEKGGVAAPPLSADQFLRERLREIGLLAEA